MLSLDSEFFPGGWPAGRAAHSHAPPLAASWLRHRQAAPRVEPLQQRLRLLGHNVALLHAVKRVAGRQLRSGQGVGEGRDEGRGKACGAGERRVVATRGTWAGGAVPAGLPAGPCTAWVGLTQWHGTSGTTLPHEAWHTAIGHVMPTHADCPHTHSTDRPCSACALEPMSMPAHQVVIKPRTSKKPGWRASSLGPSSTKWRNASCRYTVHMSGTCGGA